MKRTITILLFIFSLTINSMGQTDSTQVKSSEKRSFISKQILPLGLITTGLLLNIGDIKHRIQDKIPNTDNGYDDFIQYIPMAQLYVFDALSLEHQNTVFDQTKYLLISQLVSATTVHLLKNVIHVERPTGDGHSFPSGHTTNAFVGATVLYHEFKDTEPLLAWSGYLFATTTGVLRMTNNAHWLPDVLAGAGIGILTTNLVYHFEPLKNFQPFKKKKDLTFIPEISAQSVGLLCRF